MPSGCPAGQGAPDPEARAREEQAPEAQDPAPQPSGAQASAPRPSGIQPSGVPGAETADLDPYAEEVVRDPQAVYARLRTSCPVARGTRWGGFWALLTYRDVVAASTTPHEFSSASGVVIPINPLAGRRVPMHVDPPEHTAYRRILNPAFHADRVAALAPVVAAIAERVLTPILARRGGDLIGGYTSPLASYALAAFLGMPEEFGTRLEQHSVRFEAAQDSGDAPAVERENGILYGYAREVLDAHRRGGGDRQGLIGALLAGRVDGRRLTDEEIVGSVRQIFIAGHIAVAAALGSAIRHLAADQTLQDRLRREPQSVPAAVEELLRLHTPNQGFARTATRDVRIGGRAIRAGEQVALVYTSANRDASVFPDPDRCDIERRPQRHLAFGHGVHKCVGMELARLELRTGITVLLAATAWFALDGEPTPLRWPVHGPATLPVRVVPALPRAGER